MYSDNSTFLDSMDISRISQISISLLFCFNTLVVLVYFIRRRVRLGLEIRRIPADQMVRQEYKNYFMNLKTTIKITNFIILILTLELLENILFIQVELKPFVKQLSPGFLVHYLIKTYPYSVSLLFAMRLTYVPLLSLIMNFLWLVYRKYEYKYTMIRWTVYIVIRGFVVIIWFRLLPYMSPEYRGLANVLLNIFFTFSYVFDFIQYVYYSKRFYSHLKSREKEIRLFYFDKEAYLYSRWIRIHFLVSNVLVTSALLLFTLGDSFNSIRHLVDWIVWLFYSQAASTLEYNYPYNLLYGDIIIPVFIVYRGLLNFNYLYIIIVIIYKSIRSRIKLYNINEHIKPIVQVYHNSVYNKYRLSCIVN